MFWDRSYYNRWPLVVQLSDQVEVDWFRQVPPWSELDEGQIGASSIGTMQSLHRVHHVTTRTPARSFMIALAHSRGGHPASEFPAPTNWKLGCPLANRPRRNSDHEKILCTTIGDHEA